MYRDSHNVVSCKTEPGQDSECISPNENVRQVCILGEVWGMPLASAMGFLTLLCKVPFLSSIHQTEEARRRESAQ